MFKPIFADGMKIVSFGDYVAVAWNTKQTRKETNFGGDHFVGHVVEAEGDPFIIFPVIRQTRTGEYYLDDDDSIRGGVSAEAARQVAAELMAAAKWMEENS